MPSPIEVILIPTLMIFLGYVLKCLGVFKAEHREILSNIVLYIALPSMIFINLRTADVSGDMLFLPVLGLATSGILLTVAYIYCRLRNYSKKTSWTIMIAASIMNTGFIGFPVTLGVFGNDGFLHALFFDLSTTAMVVMYGVVLAGKFGGDRKRAVRQIVTFIPLWALLFALIFNVLNLEIGYVAETILNYFAQATIPLILLCLGLSLDFKNIGSNISDSLVVSVIKLVLAPAVIFVLLTAFKINGMAFNVGVLEAGMSTAMNALVLAITYDLDTDLMSSLIFTNVVLSVFTLTAIISMLTF